MERKFILASNNNGKIREMKEKLNSLGITVISQKEAGYNIEVDETGTTFEENATLKAEAIYKLSKLPVISDDSGLEIDALNGEPGIYSARYAGENATDEERNQYLIDEVNKHENRNASVICSLVYYDGVDFTIGTGEIKGIIAKEMRGTNGFGFDSIFELPNGLTLAETSSEEKNAISARAMAARDLQKKLTR